MTNNIDGDDLSKVSASQPEPKQNGYTNYDSLQLATVAIHADDPVNVLTDVAPPIHVSTTFRYAKDPSKLVGAAEKIERGLPAVESGEHIYSRHTTHGSSRLESILSKLLKAPCLTYSSGLSAFYAVLVEFQPKKVAIGDGYHGCHGTLAVYQKLTGCKILPLDCKPEELDAGDLIWLETPVNPTGRAFNIEHYARNAHSRGAYLGIDSTFAPPPLQDPFKHGADVVMHSGTKYFGGHSDMLCGVVATRMDTRLSNMAETRLFLGSVMGGLETWLGVRSLRTLELRVKKASDNADFIISAIDGALTGATVGTGLSQSDVETVKKVVKEVHHASLQVEDRKTWLRKQMPDGFGPVFSIILNSTELAKTLPSKLHLFHHATSLGGVESLIEWRSMSDSTVTGELLRLSIGIEDERDLLDDLLQGFRALSDQFKL